ncbi:MAG TPA: PQQ-binding-like beta-propeller repeat protein, partial [Gemmataceae bacterium]|nr:PQQ-binding-like beta-propeller repeat protein [Gemmataceae bacterium]
MFGYGTGRNMVNLTEKGLPTEWDTQAKTNVKWAAKVGSRAYALTVADGKVYVGTNNSSPKNPRDTRMRKDGKREAIDKSCLLCFDAATGKLLWQHVNDKLPSGMVHDWPEEGICSSPAVEGNRLYYVNNRCEVVCLDTNGLADGNQGVTDEKYKDPTDADVIWRLDMMKELNVFPHNLSASSPVIAGDYVCILTGNGVDEDHINIPSPDAPSFLAVNKRTGKVAWKSNEPGRNIMHGQWSNPSYAVIGGKPTVIFPGGDGWLYGLEPETGNVIWKFDANPKDATYELGGKGTKSDFIGSAVVYKGKVYIGTGQDPEHLEGVGHFWCIDPAGKTGDISPVLVADATKSPPVTKPNPNSGMVWHYGGNETRPYAKRDYVFSRTMSTACIVDDVVYIAELAGYVQCLDANTGKKFWQWDTKSNIWGSCYYVDGKVLVANEDGDMYIFKHEKAPQVLDEVAVGSAAAVDAEKKAKAAGKGDAD